AFGAGRGPGEEAGGQGGQDREAFSGALVHAGLAAAQFLAVDQILAANRARGGPRSPAGGFLHRPLGDVEVEGPDRAVLAAAVRARTAFLQNLPVGAGGAGGLRQDAVLPSG